MFAFSYNDKTLKPWNLELTNTETHCLSEDNGADRHRHGDCSYECTDHIIEPHTPAFHLRILSSSLSVHINTRPGIVLIEFDGISVCGGTLSVL